MTEFVDFTVVNTLNIHWGRLILAVRGHFGRNKEASSGGLTVSAERRKSLTVVHYM